MNTSTLCEACLSSNRQLTIVSGNDRQAFTNILDNADYVSDPLTLCWECTAIIRKVIKFKRQVQNAHRLLISSMLRKTKLLHSLSNLTYHTNTAESHIILSDHSDYSGKPLIIKSSQENAMYNSDLNENPNFQTSPNKSKVEKETEIAVEREPLFIKVELEEDHNYEQEFETTGDLDTSYDDQDVTNDSDDNEEKITVKSDPMDCHEELSSEEFDESDEEPLKKRRKTKPKKKNKTERGLLDKDVSRPVRADKQLLRLGIPPGTVQPVRLTWEEVEEERQKVLTSESYLRYPHRCDDCALGFNHSSKLHNHMKKHQPSSGQLCCAVCKVRCRTQHALAAHTRRHLIRWRCVSCGVLASRGGGVADHSARAHHSAAPAHTCNVCGHIATTLSKLRNHLKSHAERQKCELCGKTFRDKSTLKTHLFIHKGVKEHACPTCGKMFLFKKAMQLHRATHDAPALLYCHQCDMNFKNQMSYYQHMKYNLKHVDPARLKYTCGECGKKFMKASRLAEHNTALHLKLTPITCPHEGCSFACASRAVLRAHARSTHRSAPAPRNHVCHRCGKTYTNKKSLEGHLRSHTGERPHTCAKCGANFTYHAALYNHTRLVHRQTPRKVPTTAVDAGPASWTATPQAPPEQTTELAGS